MNDAFTKRSQLPVLEISIENDVEASQRQSAMGSRVVSPNRQGMKFCAKAYASPIKQENLYASNMVYDNAESPTPVRSCHDSLNQLNQ